MQSRRRYALSEAMTRRERRESVTSCDRIAVDSCESKDEALVRVVRLEVLVLRELLREISRPCRQETAENYARGGDQGSPGPPHVKKVEWRERRRDLAFALALDT